MRRPYAFLPRGAAARARRHRRAVLGSAMAIRWGREAATTAEAIEYKSFIIMDREVFLREFVYLRAGPGEDPHIGIVLRLWQDRASKARQVQVRWLYRPSCLPDSISISMHSKELIFALGGEGVEDTTPLESICGRCKCKMFPEGRPSEAEIERLGFFVYRGYDASSRELVSNIGDLLRFCSGRRKASSGVHARPAAKKMKMDVREKRPEQHGTQKAAESEDTSGERAGEKAASMSSTKRSEAPPAPEERPRERALFNAPWLDEFEHGIEKDQVLVLRNFELGYTEDEIKQAVKMISRDNRLKVSMVPEDQLPSYVTTGQAVVVFSSPSLAEQALKTLQEEILLLTPNGRPCLATRLRAKHVMKYFPGQVPIEKRVDQNTKLRNAVSSAHCAKSNTIEYEMALQWRVLYERHEKQWEMLYQLQKEELQKL